MENSELNRSQREKSSTERPYSTLKGTGEVREYIEAMKASNNLDALQTLLIEVNKIYQDMLKRNGGEYEFQYHQYVLGEVEQALASFSE